MSVAAAKVKPKKKAKPPRKLARHAAYAFDLALFLLALVTLAVVVNYFAHRPELRIKLDATKTRAYSLSDQTRQLLAGLQGTWTIALLMVEDAADPRLASRTKISSTSCS